MGKWIVAGFEPVSTGQSKAPAQEQRWCRATSCVLVESEILRSLAGKSLHV